MLISYVQDTSVKSEGGSKMEWDLNMKSDIVAKETMKRHRLDKFLKEVTSNVGEIWKYVPFPAGTLPKMLVKKNPQASYFFTSTSSGKENIHKLVEAASTLTSCSLLWMLKEKDGLLQPCGLALVTNKQLVLTGGAEMVLE